MGVEGMDGYLWVDGWVLVIWMDAMGTDGCYEDGCWRYGWMDAMGMGAGIWLDESWGKMGVWVIVWVSRMDEGMDGCCRVGRWVSGAGGNAWVAV